MTPKQQELTKLVSELTLAVRSHACSTAAMAFSPGPEMKESLARSRNELEKVQNQLRKFIEENVS